MNKKDKEDNSSIREDNTLIDELNKLKITSYDVREEIQRLTQILQNIEVKILEYKQKLNS